MQAIKTKKFLQPRFIALNEFLPTFSDTSERRDYDCRLVETKCFVGRCQGLHQMAHILRLGAALSPPVSKHTNHLSMTNGNNSKPTTSLSGKHSAAKQKTSINAVAESVCVFSLNLIKYSACKRKKKSEDGN